MLVPLFQENTSFVYHFTSIEDSYFCITYLFLKKIIDQIIKSRKNSKSNVVKFISILTARFRLVLRKTKNSPIIGTY